MEGRSRGSQGRNPDGTGVRRGRYGRETRHSGTDGRAEARGAGVDVSPLRPGLGVREHTGVRGYHGLNIVNKYDTRYVRYQQDLVGTTCSVRGQEHLGTRS